MTATTREPARFVATSRAATRRIFSGSATDVPPNFITTVLAPMRVSEDSSSGSVSYAVSVMARLYGR